MTDPEFFSHYFPLDGDPGPAPPLAPGEASALIAGALDVWAPPTPPASSGGGAGGWFLGGGAALGLVVGGGLLYSFLAADGVPEPEASLPEVGVAVEAAREPEARAEQLEEAFLGLEADEAEPAAVAPELSEAAPRRASPRPQAAFPAPPNPESGESVEDLLGRANELRRARRWAEAERTYRAVVARAPGSRAGQIAGLSAAGLQLDRLRNPSEALRLYRRARTQGGPLAARAELG
ncbi:MAG: hypothetical protein AAGF12_38660, partial [Myxococcota bacterium]